MTSVKERIMGAVTIMSEKDAQKIWELIQATFVLSNAEVVTPDDDELEAIKNYEAGVLDYQPVVSQEELIRELDL